MFPEIRKMVESETADDNVRDTLAYLSLAADIGCPRLRVFGGKIGSGLNREAAIELVANSLRSCAEAASDYDVQICVETHDDWCNPTHLAEVMKRVDHPSIGINWDIMHPVRTTGCTMAEAYRDIEPWIMHIHFHDGVVDDGKIKLTPIGDGIVDHRATLEILINTGYDGYLSGEWINWEPHIAHLPRELAKMKDYEREIIAQRSIR